MKLILPALILLSFSVHAKLIDKVAGVINDKIYTLSEIKRVQDTISIRKEIAPFIYTKNSYTQKDTLKVLQNIFIIKDKLEEQGFIVSDDSVEDRIKDTQRSLNLNRKELIQFLASKNITFSEYFEILRQAMEFNIFNRRIIAPLVTITDQELKNEFYKSHSSSKVANFNYEIVDYTISKKLVQSSDLQKLPNILNKYRKTGTLPEIYKDFSMDDLGKVSNEDLPSNIQKVLKPAKEKDFSKPIVIDNTVHIFYVVKKSIAESKEYLRQRAAIYNRLFLQRANSLAQNWLSREALNYYILENI